MIHHFIISRSKSKGCEEESKNIFHLMQAYILKNEYFDSIDPYAVNKTLSSVSYREDLLQLDYTWTKYLKYYLILTYGEKNIPPLTKEILLINRYYLVKRFYHHYILNFGEDAGIEQQIGNIIEEMVNELHDFDWNILEEISITIGHEGI